MSRRNRSSQHGDLTSHSAHVGLDSETPVTDDYKEGDNKFIGQMVIEVGPLKLGAAEKEELRKGQATRRAAE
jgi:hypothetical protein